MAQYDSIAKEYNVYTTEHSWSAKIYQPSLAKMMGEVKGKKILDLACGDGTQTRWMKQWGASHIIGVDISSGMLQKAREGAEKHNLTIEYMVIDALNITKLGEFDIVTAFYLLNYASSERELLQMCQKIKLNMKVGSKFVGVVPFLNEPQHYHIPEKLGFYLQVPGNVQEGDRIVGTTKVNNTTFSYLNLFLFMDCFIYQTSSRRTAYVQGLGPDLVG